MRGEALPASLAREGAMMRDALIRDLADAPGVEVVASHDDRVGPPPLSAISRAISQGADVWATWAALAAETDVAWAIAPETDGLLLRLTKMLRATGVRVIGPNEETIALASSKTRTAERLIAHGIATPAVWRKAPPDVAGPFVLKPDDGAGCEATRLVAEPPDAPGANDILQPYVAGEAASLTVLRAEGVTRLLSVNRQHVEIRDGTFRFRGVTVAALDDQDGRLAALAVAVGEAMPGLDGVFGIDLVLTPDGAVVIEVNPRLTTAYCGLREALGENPLLMVPPFDSGRGPSSSAPRPVEIAL